MKTKLPAKTRMKLDQIAREHCGHIRKPYKLTEIIDQVESNEYSAELMLQHLLLWVKRNTEG